LSGINAVETWLFLAYRYEALAVGVGVVALVTSRGLNEYITVIFSLALTRCTCAECWACLPTLSTDYQWNKLWCTAGPEKLPETGAHREISRFPGEPVRHWR